ncbi:MAG: UDP-4-amino-4,6-dideoxy-N-acetyl-beta-L-altrosamine transaminase [Deferribacteraceae bacterium]|jgi:UDP-4-amino-4,6-dideoxy-N-acetyl-beta-L-altrosamine transaminase|nr:UDP-4-amino-4,6-dideoxy-N-acetyl-beta-L-altrosamine transaminase [Deferribacteraceae bacterium]
MIKYPYGRQWITEEDIGAVAEALRGEYLTGGGYVSSFEDAFAKAVNVKYAVAVANGTAALHIAYMATGLCAGDTVITTPLSFAATANAALYCNAKPVFVDIDNTGNINPELIEAAITNNTRLLAPVHYAGQPADMARIHAIADKHNIFVVEDACHALGARYDSGEKVGSCCYSDMTVFSFHPVKHITTGEGGMITTNNKALAERLRLLRSHGIVTTENEPWHKDMQLLGYNYRMTDIQAALGLSQLKRLDSLLQARIQIAASYDAMLANSPYFTPLVNRAGANHARHLYPMLLISLDRDKFMQAAQREGVGLQVHYGLIYKHNYYQKNGYSATFCPLAEDIAARIVSLPEYPQLSEADLGEIVQILARVAESAC